MKIEVNKGLMIETTITAINKISKTNSLDHQGQRMVITTKIVSQKEALTKN
jgi:hypothetical protein